MEYTYRDLLEELKNVSQEELDTPAKVDVNGTEFSIRGLYVDYCSDAAPVIETN
jgi:hypothetical protein